MGVRVTVVDQGTGNLFSVVRALEHLGAEPEFVSTAAGVAAAERLILPGVGAFGDGMRALHHQGLVEPLRSAALERQCPVLGICLGMQLLFDTGEEMGRHEGLGLIRGRVERVPAQTVEGAPLKVPHIGWNGLHVPEARTDWRDTIMAGQEEGEAVYFVHSYAGHPDDDRVRLADCVYGGHRLCVAIQSGKVSGCQFHPERSGPAGLEILRRFLEA